MSDPYPRLHALIDAIEEDLKSRDYSPRHSVWELLDKLRLTIIEHEGEAL